MKLEFSSNLDSAASIVGTFQGIADATESDKFLSMVCLRAHNKAMDTFNQVAALSASRRKNLRYNFNHMYEYGVAGITPGTPSITDPTSPAARLWVYNTVPTKGGVETFVTFRDATMPNPKPEQRPDLRRMPREVVAKMSNKDYVFRERASITESGQYVEILPRDAKALIFPAKESMNGQGYQFWTSRQYPLVTQPGRYHKGAFTAFFNKWWSRDADAIINQHVHQSIAGKIGAIQRRMNKTGTVKPISMSSVASAYERGRKAGKAEMMSDIDES